MSENRLTSIEMLLMLSQDLKTEGDELVEELQQRGLAHARRVHDLSNMIEQARGLMEGEKRRFQHYLPPQRQAPREDRDPRLAEQRIPQRGPEDVPAPRVIAKGPRVAEG